MVAAAVGLGGGRFGATLTERAASGAREETAVVVQRQNKNEG